MRSTTDTAVEQGGDAVEEARLADGATEQGSLELAPPGHVRPVTVARRMARELSSVANAIPTSARLRPVGKP